MVSGTRRQILGLLRSLGLVRQRGPGDIKDLNQNSRNWSVIKAVVGASLYPNFIKVCRIINILISETIKYFFSRKVGLLRKTNNRTVSLQSTYFILEQYFEN